ncbi:DUF2783 domain-containing protein (plasmid) [Paroceanicella profunda]|uniref:DUF2783 domain-containing protein n=2 Tax=Paroceanicella profunda TaxID=2579971 RepID=A0A5B8FJF8_9RHOB|nr:DUF2783 domain-containing protein [Paroceanicella profunda]QDL94268.1 DUF2783 domain-containing protein [Paroceanicella profunda]
MDPRSYNLGAEGDAIYAELIALHEGLSEEESAALNARLVLVLANALARPEEIRLAFAVASRGAEATAPRSG